MLECSLMSVEAVALLCFPSVKTCGIPRSLSPKFFLMQYKDETIARYT